MHHRVRSIVQRQIRCVDCGTVFEACGKTFRIGARSRCGSCQLLHVRKRRKEQYWRKPRSQIALGSKIHCECCQASIIKTSGTRKFCTSCRAERDQKVRQQISLAYRIRHRDQIRDRKKNRLAADPTYAVSNRMSCAIRRSLKGGNNGKPWEKAVGFTREELARHLERQFTSGMSWDNLGRGKRKWEIDHIRPLSSFGFTTIDDSEFKAAWCLTNLRPLWSEENNRKHAKRLFLI